MNDYIHSRTSIKLHDYITAKERLSGLNNTNDYRLFVIIYNLFLTILFLGLGILSYDFIVHRTGL